MQPGGYLALEQAIQVLTFFGGLLCWVLRVTSQSVENPQECRTTRPAPYSRAIVIRQSEVKRALQELARERIALN